MLDNITCLETSEIRWEVLKTMLDTFPDLLKRTETYLLTKKITLKSNYPRNTDLKMNELVKKAIKEYRQNTLNL